MAAQNRHPHPACVRAPRPATGGTPAGHDRRGRRGSMKAPHLPKRRGSDPNDQSPSAQSTPSTARKTRMSYYGNRHYSPRTGRWLSRDPIGERGGANLYEFVWNDGLNWLDILGKEPWPTNNQKQQRREKGRKVPIDNQSPYERKGLQIVKQPKPESKGNNPAAPDEAASRAGSAAAALAALPQEIASWDSDIKGYKGIQDAEELCTEGIKLAHKLRFPKACCFCCIILYDMYPLTGDERLLRTMVPITYYVAKGACYTRDKDGTFARRKELLEDFETNYVSYFKKRSPVPPSGGKWFVGMQSRCISTSDVHHNAYGIDVGNNFIDKLYNRWAYGE